MVKSVKSTPLVYLVTPVFNRKVHTLKYLASLGSQTYKNFRVVIVDDASTDGTKEAIQDQYPNAILLEGDGNQWWSGGTNLGVKKALEDKADYILTVNDDLEVESDYIESIVKDAKAHPKSLIGSIVLDKKNPLHVWYFGADFDQKTGVMKHISGLRKDFTKITKTEWLTGMGVLIPAEVFQKVGVFNSKDFPQYFGDVELSLRAKEAGYRLLVSPRCAVISDVESNWVSKSLQKPRMSFWYQLFFTIRSPYHLSSRVKFYKNYWPGNYRMALRKLYFGDMKTLYRAWLSSWVHSKKWLKWSVTIKRKVKK
ncbi:MAG: glycosyltransferase family 2 protein [Candidatus Saccharibacteria bacterium]